MPVLQTSTITSASRDYPFNPFNLCSKKLTTDIWDLTDFHHERKRAYPFNLCNLWSKNWSVSDILYVESKKVQFIVNQKNRDPMLGGGC